jgi:hypothetical protein
MLKRRASGWLNQISADESQGVKSPSSLITPGTVAEIWFDNKTGKRVELLQVDALICIEITMAVAW